MGDCEDAVGSSSGRRPVAGPDPNWARLEDSRKDTPVENCRRYILRSRRPAYSISQGAGKFDSYPGLFFTANIPSTILLLDFHFL